MAQVTTPENPMPVRVVSKHIGDWIHRLGHVWVEGQITQLTRRPGARVAFLALRDPSANVSLQVTCPADVLNAVVPPLSEGAQVVVHGRPSWFYARGTLSLNVDEVRTVGIGTLLARIDQVRRLLDAEGLFAAERKRRPPFVPTRVGLICGRASAAERDVLENAGQRAPGVPFQVENVPVQGPVAVPSVIDAIERLDADSSIDVIIVARGGGSVEDLLPFSDEALVRAVSRCRTPVVSAIGHESDTPLVDLVADVRASTPTDAAKRVVPDVAEEMARVREARHRLRVRVETAIAHERTHLAGLRARPVLARPVELLVEPRRQTLLQVRREAYRAVDQRLTRERLVLDHARSQVAALSPAATLKRGYAVVQRREDGSVVRAPTDAAPGDPLRLRLADGELAAVVTDAEATT